MKKMIIAISGMTCNHCEKRITSALKKINGIKEIKVSFDSGLVNVTYEETIKLEDNIKKVINDLGYKYKGMVNNNKINRTSFKEIFPILSVLMIIYLIIGSIAGFNFINIIPKVDKTTPLIMIFLIGLLTSVHCIGMCGAINLAVSVSDDNKSSILNPLLYNLGRIISYTLTGAIVGGLGSIISFSGNLQGLVIILTSIFMLMMGLSMLGWLPQPLHKFLPRLKLTKIKINSKRNTPIIVGLLNGIMPCGPLQAMQIYALSTGSIFLGALSMFLFSLGTIPLVFGFGLLFSFIKEKYNITIQRTSSILIIILSILMFTRGMNILGIDIFKANYNKYIIADIKNGYQYVEIELSNKYPPILVQKDIPVIFNIKVDDIRYYGCTSSIRIPKYKINRDLKTGDNIIKFTPNKTGDIMYSCWMGMVKSNIKVIDNINNIK